MGFQTIRFLQWLYYSWEVAQMRLSNCLCGRKHLATRQRKPDFFRTCFIPKVQLFCHTFLSLSQGWKVFGSNNCRACKRHGFQHSVSDEPNETDPWRLQAGTAPLTTEQQDWFAPAEEMTQYVLNLEAAIIAPNSA